ncbi:MAG: hypothetical protein HC769_18185 [Cyanobacteria bacterium CRU_2_1]|nr:hypothetical protein [Cyanobacteria bacterium RU_5_0]NJR60587.1 hypothetical protein [Cyanobacteria bacterium CRU_2_1]
MKPISSLVKLLSLLALTLFLLLGWQLFTPAQDSSFLTSRVSRLETDNTTLRSRISRLENTVSRLSAEVGIDYPDPPSEDISGDGSINVAPSVLAEDPTFQRLATLVIELKERVVAVETQIAELETRVSPR